MKKALIVGVTGQDGAYLSEFLLKKGYEVHGTVRRSSSINIHRLESTVTNKKYFHTHYADVTDGIRMVQLIQSIKPDEVYNLSAMSDVGISFENPDFTSNVTGLGAVRILDAIKMSDLKIRFYQASSSEQFGISKEVPQTERTPFNSQSPYAAAKVFAHQMTINYRDAYKIYACNGILFNHESPLRGENFVSKKISKAVAEISQGSDQVLKLGNLEARRDWGYAPEYVEGMWMMLQLNKADDYILATGISHTVRSFAEEAFNCVGIDLEWKGVKGSASETGHDRKTGRLLVSIDPGHFRPLEVDNLIGDPSKAYKDFGWKARTNFKDLVSLMVKADLKPKTDAIYF